MIPAAGAGEVMVIVPVGVVHVGCVSVAMGAVVRQLLQSRSLSIVRVKLPETVDVLVLTCIKYVCPGIIDVFM